MSYPVNRIILYPGWAKTAGSSHPGLLLGIPDGPGYLTRYAPLVIPDGPGNLPRLAPPRQSGWAEAPPPAPTLPCTGTSRWAGFPGQASISRRALFTSRLGRHLAPQTGSSGSDDRPASRPTTGSLGDDLERSLAGLLRWIRRLASDTMSGTHASMGGRCVRSRDRSTSSLPDQICSSIVSAESLQTGSVLLAGSFLQEDSSCRHIQRSVPTTSRDKVKGRRQRGYCVRMTHAQCGQDPGSHVNNSVSRTVFLVSLSPACPLGSLYLKSTRGRRWSGAGGMSSP